ncbi:MAG: bifunctional glutamate N-acetyltransferase/amino-acid acetyltransferase ArgJ [Myxococcaceae bacterium]|nr:bifunctional glutamate N-acetyltransferase/amino-acid acetyltransferase ArgJ [Myxococcaceae bacterium]
MNVAKGFLFAGVHAGIKPQRKDLALVFSPTPCSAAACQTVNKAKAAPVIDAERRLPAAGIHAVLINSGNANALTGPAGVEDVAAVTAATAKQLGLEGGVLMASTGVIGVKLPREKILAALPKLSQSLAAAPETAAEAIITTDTRMKLASRTVRTGGKTVTLSAIAKGSGMIAPQMATVIAVIVTDAAITPPMLHQALQGAMSNSFNALTVDGDMSTNDAVFALANGLAKNAPITDPGPDYAAFCKALDSLCVELAREVAADGEGATKLLEVEVKHAPSDAIARDVAKSIAGSPLVKAAIFGCDPNWGRVLATVGARAGSQGWALEPGQAKVTIQDLTVFDKKPVLTEPERLRARMREPQVHVDVDLRAGKSSATSWGCDLSYDYVKINADYTSLIRPAADGSVEKDDRLTNYSPKFKVTLITQALGYISRFSSKRCVLKVGRQMLAKDSLMQAFCEDVALLKSVGMVPIVVHGEAPGNEAQDAKLRELLVNASTNAGLVSLIHRNGATAVGISGHDGALLKARGPSPAADGFQLGTITEVKTELLEMFLAKGYVPVIAPVGMAQDGSQVPLDGDAVAAEVAAALGANKLVYLTGRAGVTEKDELLRQVSTSQLEAKLGTGTFTANIEGKSRGALTALQKGVEAVHVIDARVPHSLIAELFTEDGVGTLVTRG